ncbi:MAG: TIGR03564 family F420-dependent LLM class oxidoreductase [Acidimicrobiales bacterium]
MRISVGLDTDSSLDATLERARALRDLGFDCMWSSQIMGPDTLTVLAIVGREFPDVDLGVGVVPIQPRHPTMLAAQARTVQDAIGGHLSLGIGLSHRVVVEGLWGMAFERPAEHMSEYLDALIPLLAGENADAHGSRVSAVSIRPLGPQHVTAPSLLVAAMGTRMLGLAGARTDGTVLWMTGRATVADHVAPVINAAAAAVGRAAPRIVCGLPIAVTDDVAGARDRINETFAVYATLPSYAAMLEREGATTPADASLIGSHAQVLEALDGLAAAGVTEFNAHPSGTRDECDAALDALRSYAGLSGTAASVR